MGYKDRFTKDQLRELQAEYHRYRRDCVKKKTRPNAFNAWLPKEEDVAEAPKKVKAKKEEKVEIIELAPAVEPMPPPEPTPAGPEDIYFK